MRRFPWFSTVACLAIAACAAFPAKAAKAAAPQPVFSISCGQVTEGGWLPCTVTKSAKANSYSKVQVGVVDGSAANGKDYIWEPANAPVLTFGNNVLSMAVSIQTLDNNVTDGARTLTARVSPVRFAAIGPKGSSTGTIQDNDVAPPTKTCPDGMVVLANQACPAPLPTEPAPVPTPPAEPGGYVVSPSLAGLPGIASEFDPSTTITKSYQPAPNPPAEMVGAFRMVCSAAHGGRFDPLLYPGQDQAGHEHRFYGNNAVTGKTTRESLRRSGFSTCGDPKSNPANRSGYWIAKLLDGKGNEVQIDQLDLYYKRWPKTSADCTDGRRVKACVNVPTGIRFVWGFDMLANKPAQYPFGFYCSSVPGTFPTMAEAVAGGRCPVGASLFVRSDSPSCWDGKNLDSPDHRSHVRYMEDTHLGYWGCPSTHPYHFPALTLSFSYRIAPGDDPTLWRFSSDEMHPELPAGSTMHADYFEGWDPTVKAMWEDNCIDRMLNCVGGALGNGYSMNGADQPTYYIDGVQVRSWTNPNHLVPIPQ